MLRAFTILSLWFPQFIVSATVLAAVVSATVAGRITNTLGRRPVILISAVTFLLGSLCMGFANGVPMLMVGRAVVGLAIGLASMAGPLYIAECAAPQYRGLLVTVCRASGSACGLWVCCASNKAASLSTGEHSVHHGRPVRG